MLLSPCSATFALRLDVPLDRPVDLVDGCDAWDMLSGFETADRFDTDAGQGDLCFFFFAATGSLAVIISVLPAGRVVFAFAPVAASSFPDLPTPPPKV